VLADRAHAICSTVQVVGWSERADSDARARKVEVDVFGRYTFDWRGQRVTAPMAGRHSVSNALLALTVADLLHVAPKDAVRGLGSARMGSMRGEFQRIGDLTLIVDCYNANPQSVRASLDVLEDQAVTGRKVAILGSMLELGTAGPGLHADVFADAVGRDIDIIVATGAFADAAVRAGGHDERLVIGDDWQAAYPPLRERLEGGEVILLKASRGIALENIIPRLHADFGVTVETVDD
jgi:UDP-N-acetylmuramoyl-tripeptide--D-alanyl-D-alanine ligase